MIYKFNRKQYELVKKYVKPCYESEEAQQYIHNGIIFDDIKGIVTVSDVDIDEFMTATDEAIIVYGMVNQDYLTELGCELQFLYDEIYYQTKNRK